MRELVSIEWLKENLHKKVPYFSTILKSGEKYNLPINKNGEIYLYTFDKNGKRIDKQIITPANNVYKK